MDKPGVPRMSELDGAVNECQRSSLKRFSQDVLRSSGKRKTVFR